MKLRSILATSLAATLAALVVGAQAAPDAGAAAEPATAQTTPKAVKPHSHMVEKGYAPAPAKAAPSEGTPAADLTTKHLHPRDAK